MKDRLNFDHAVIGELIARRWQEDPAYYTLSRNTDGGWLEPLWTRRADPSGVELHWTRGAPSHPESELNAPE
jgi:hypothetical protein